MTEFTNPLKNPCYCISSEEFARDYCILPDIQKFVLFKLRLSYCMKGSSLDEDDLEALFPSSDEKISSALAKVLKRFFRQKEDFYVDERMERALSEQRTQAKEIEEYIEKKVKLKVERFKAGFFGSEKKKQLRDTVGQNSVFKAKDSETKEFESETVKQIDDIASANKEQTVSRIESKPQANLHRVPDKSQANVQQTDSKLEANSKQIDSKTEANSKQTASKSPANAKQNVQNQQANPKQTGQQTISKTEFSAEAKSKQNNFVLDNLLNNKEKINDPNNAESAEDLEVSRPHVCVHTGACTRAQLISRSADTDIGLINKNINKSESASESAEESKNLNSWNTRELDSISEAVRWLSEHGLNPATAASFERKNADRMRALPSIVASLGAEAEDVLERCRQAKADKGDPFEHAVNFVVTSLERRFRQRQQRSEKSQKSPSASAPPKRFRDIDYREGIERLNPDGTFVLKPRSERMP